MLTTLPVVRSQYLLVLVPCVLMWCSVPYTFRKVQSTLHAKQSRSRTTRQFRVSLGRFDHIEPSLTTVMKGEAGQKGSLVSVRGVSTAPNLHCDVGGRTPTGMVLGGGFDLTEPPRTTGCSSHHSSSRGFKEVRCSRTSPNTLATALQASFPLHHSSSRGFGVVEPPRIHSNLPCRPASPFITVVLGG